MKKVSPEKQTEQLRRAKLEFLKRNPKLYEGFKKRFAELMGLLEGLEEREIEEVLTESLPRPAAADASFQFLRSWITVMQNMDEHPLFTDPDEKGVLYKEQILLDATDILKIILAPFQNPAECLLVACDLTRPKKVILAEAEKVIDDALQAFKESTGVLWVQTETGWEKEPLPQSRIKWLSRADEILEVWDLYTRAGRQSARTTFPMIARKLGRPESTVKDQWRLAYEKIYGETYTPEVKFSSEEKRREADSLCASCTEAKCYRQAGGEDSISWFPCTEYLELAGTERKLRTVELADWMRHENLDDD